MKTICAAALAATLGAAAAEPQKLTLRVLSGRPDMVTAGSALVEIRGFEPGSVRVTVNGRDAGSAFRAGGAGAALGLVRELKPGKSVIEARRGRERARLEVINHPVTGPVFSGPHQDPFICQTEEAGLGPALDSDCSAKTKVTYLYKSTDPPPPPSQRPAGGLPAGFKVFEPAAARPADVARTTTTEGKTVDYIVRVEMGTINRAIYVIAFLHQPGAPLPDPWTRTDGWNGRLVYSFGGGCRVGYRQAHPGAGLEDGLLSKGYATAKSSLNVFGNNCDDVISAETLMLVKEHFIKSFGLPVYTIGSGGSGGSIQQHLIAQNYPGLLDGITPAASYPDITSVAPPVSDCTLLARAFAEARQPWTEAQKTAVSGFATWRTCESWIRSHYSPGWLEVGYCDASMPKEKIYDPVRNPRGVRCTMQDNQVNVYGRDKNTGFAPPFMDNAGVQYGLAAFNAGKIGAEQFVELNERAGGFDVDGKPIPQRAAASPQALRIAYRTGRVNSAGGSLASLPIIDYRLYVDDRGDIHDRVRSFVMRARLVRAHGSAANQVILTNPRAGDVIQTMDRWLERIAKDSSSDSPAVKVVRNKPADLTDACWTKEGERISEPASYDSPGRCNQLYPPHADPRMVAGAGLANDVLKCALKPLSAQDYRQPLSAEQLQRLRKVFPQGVCDYSRPGLEQAAAEGSWRRY